MADKEGLSNLTDRRKRWRYPFSAPVRHAVLGQRNQTEYAGEVANMNSFSVYVRCAERPQLGNWVRASIEWPVLLNGKISLQLICNGVVARVDDHGFAFEFHRHEFRTKRTISIAEGRVWQAEPEQIAKMA